MSEIFSLLADSSTTVINLDRSGIATCACLAVQFVKRDRTAIILPGKPERFYEALSLGRLFLPNLSAQNIPVTQPIWERPLLSLPSFRKFNEKGMWADRLATLYALSRGKPTIIVTEPQSLLLRYVPRNFFENHILEVSTGNEFSPDLILEQCIEWGYERVSLVTSPGEVARRGDILDIFPPGYAKPCRLEFFGDTIDQMRLFDGETQRSLQEMSELTILPTIPLLKSPNDIKNVEKRIDQLKQTGKLSDNDAYSIKKQLTESNNAILPGMAYSDGSLIEEWLPSSSIWFLPGEADSADALAGARLLLKDELEKQDNEFTQPARIVLRRSSHPAPWNNAIRILAAPLAVGIEDTGLKFAEKDFNQFSDLFPHDHDKDRPWQTLVQGLKKMRQDQRQVLLSFSSDRSRKKFLSLAEQDGIEPQLRYDYEQAGIFALVSPFRKGAELIWDKVIILGEDILYPRAEKTPRRAVSAFKGLDSFESLKQGDLLVHRDYGIGRFAGLHHLKLNQIANDFLLLEYAGNDKLYLPVDRLGLIQRFKGPEGINPPLDKLGSQSWITGKEKAKKAIEKIAADLVEMYAYRKIAKSFRYSPPDELFREFEATFGFDETPDQTKAIQDVLEDMEKQTPMDRLICGDVGFGKTEVALRAAFRAAEEGRQVALLCPTTVLAEQHYQTFRSRLAGFPINVGLLSRFVSKAKQKEVLKACEEGQIDILIGTHRILSKDVKLPNLALLILDEEQRFGVRHKEKLKSLKKNIDVLTLTATPIPRTLQLSMSGIRDLSIIETAPLDRKPVASAVLERDDETLRKIVQREIDRKGQVFWVYNRVHDLERVAEYVRKLVPHARIGMAHGQMAENALEETMRKFWHGEIDVLVCTSIVESGLDFPRANTLVVDQAQLLGLSQLYQLRGRVGRSDRQAYAFFVVPDARRLSETAEERLRVILNMDYLGAGFQIAMEDLRLRGAGNILGEAQSGHITRVGLDLYLEMLEEAVAKQKGLPDHSFYETELNLGLAAHIPEKYIEDGKERLRYYKSLTSAQSAASREEVALDIRDRFGPIPGELQNFLAILDFKDFLSRLQTEKADIYQNSLRLTWNENQTAIDPLKVASLLQDHPNIKLMPPATLSFSYEDDLPLAEIFKQTSDFLNQAKL